MTDWADPTLLAWRDARGYTVFEAVALAPFPASLTTLSKPAAFVCINGETYWCKGNAPNARVQQGLVAELVAGRLAAKLGVGGPAAIVQVDRKILPADGSLAHLAGLVLGIRHHPGMEHCRNMQALAGGAPQVRGLIDAASRAKVVVFQSWLGAQDAQVMVSLTTGRVISIDHGDCFGNLSANLSPVVVGIPGVPDADGRDPSLVDQAVRAVESLTDEDLLEAVCQMPTAENWNADEARRRRIAEWLAGRRGQLRRVMEQWSVS